MQSSNIHSEREKQLGGGEVTDSAGWRLLKYLIPSLHSTCCANAHHCHPCTSAGVRCVHQHSGCFLAAVFGSRQEVSWAGECSFQALSPSFIHNSASIYILSVHFFLASNALQFSFSSLLICHNSHLSSFTENFHQMFSLRVYGPSLKYWSIPLLLYACPRPLWSHRCILDLWWALLMNSGGYLST